MFGFTLRVNNNDSRVTHASWEPNLRIVCIHLDKQFERIILVPSFSLYGFHLESKT